MDPNKAKLSDKIQKETSMSLESAQLGEEKKHEDKNEDMEITFSSNPKTQEKKSKESDSDQEDQKINVDLKQFYKKHAKWLVPVILIIIAIGFSTYLRIMPADLPVTDSWAEKTVDNFYKTQVEQQINQQYPNLPAQNKEALIQRELEAVKNSDQYHSEIVAVSKKFKDQLQDDSGQTYLLAIDPYHWYTYVKNHVTYGTLGDATNEEGQEIVSVRNGRFGTGITKIPLHPIATAWLFNTIQVFSKEISLMTVLFLMPVIIIGLALIPAFLIGRRIAGNWAGFVAAFLIAINVALLTRTPAGFSDTDPYNVFFPLLIAWLMIEAHYTKKTKYKWMFTILAGLATGLYAITWLGYWYIFLLILAAFIGSTLYFIVQSFVHKKTVISTFKSKEVKNILVEVGTYIVSSAVFITLFAGFFRFVSLLKAPLKIINLKDVGVTNLWPNVLTTVAEFNEVNVTALVSQMGGVLLFALSLMGLALLVSAKYKTKYDKMFLIGTILYYSVFFLAYQSISDAILFAILLIVPILIGLIKTLLFQEKTKVLPVMLLVFWIAATTFGFSRGIRFALLMVPAFALGVGVGVEIIKNALLKFNLKHNQQYKRVVQIGIIITIGILVITPFNQARDIASQQTPSMNDAWYNLLTKIKEDSSKAIITSWWDFGHWFYSISERSVTFDGAGQGERIYWVGKALLTPEEKTAVGTLRMLNCGQQKAVHVIEEFVEQDTVKAVDILNTMMYFNDKTKATKYLLQEGFTPDQIKEILPVTYCTDLYEQYLIVSEDMVGKAGVWGHFGSWDFQRAQIYQTTKEMTQGQAIDHLSQNYNFTEKQAIETYTQIQNTKADQWISSWPTYQSTGPCQEKENDTYYCTVNQGNRAIGFEIDLKNKKVSIPTSEGESVHPNSFVYVNEQGVQEISYDENTIGISVIMTPNNYLVLSDPLQAKSMFTRLFFLEGEGLQCFTKFDDRTTFNGQRIITWKVDFNCQI